MDFYTRGIQAFEQGRQRAVRNRLAELTSGYLAAPQEERAGFASQFAAVDPETGMDVATRERDRGMERLRAQATFLASASPEVQQRLYGAMRPQLATLGIDAPEQFDANLVEPIRMAAFGAGGSGLRVQSSRVGEDGQIYNIMSNGTVMPTGVMAENRQQVLETVDAQGRPVAGAFDPRRGSFGGFGGETQVPPTGVQKGGMSISVPGGQIDVADPAAAQFLRDNPAVIQGLSSGRPFDIPAGAPTQGGFIVGPDPVAQAGATAAAQARGRITAELEAAPAQAQVAANLERVRELAKGEAGRENDRIANRNGMIVALNQADQSTAAMRELIDTSIAPMINNWTTGTFGSFLSGIGGTNAANLESNLDTLKAVAGFSELTALKARGGTLGAVSEMELQMLTSLWGALRNSQSPEAFRLNLDRYMRRVEQSWQNIASEYELRYGESAQGAVDRFRDGQGGASQPPAANNDPLGIR